MGKYSNKINSYFLDWDTDYFNIKSGRIDVSDYNNAESVLIDEMKEANRKISECKFITLYNYGNSALVNQIIPKIWGRNAFLTDLNIQLYFKSNQNFDDLDTSISKIESKNELKSILSISENSYTESRFFNDPYLNKNKKKSIYTHWLSSAYEDESKTIYIFNEIDEPKGFIVVGSKNKKTVIELIAVDEEFQGRSIGKKLIDCAKYYNRRKKNLGIVVGTQVNNVQALNFYIKNGFKITNVNSIFHIWN